MNCNSGPISFSLAEIASWKSASTFLPTPGVRASIPALQRGLVWSPQQNELLWDSILRGFPIGAVVLTRWSEKLKKSDEEKDDRVTHHLLDGQQRCNAVAMGFSDPFGSEQPTDSKKVESILWLDLKPDPDRNSTRNYWIRATTTAHPWGYRRDDEAKTLAVGEIRTALERVNLSAADPEYRRPSPVNLWPAAASAAVPVPLAWLLQLPFEDDKLFWQSLGERAAASISLGWTAKVHEFCLDLTMDGPRSRIFAGIQRAHASRLMAIEAPKELLEESELEKHTGNGEGVSNIEQLFQRLNRQGTKLDGEELAYSMIKAYWPDLERPINEVSEHRMPQARMVSLGVRAALARDAKQNLPGSPTVSALRIIARKEENKKDLIQTFILQKNLQRACDLVDQWLKYDPESNPSGLLPVHLTSIALGSREVYLLLLHFAERMDGAESPRNWNKTMQGLVTLLHWFAVDKAKVANRIFAGCREEPNLANIHKALSEATTEGEMHTIHPPSGLDDFIQLTDADFKDWNWSKPVQGDGTEEGIQSRQKLWSGFLDFRGNKELLLYAQRAFLTRRFPEYDPARKDLWEAHNRPWDFDHILAWKYLYDRRDGGQFKGICDQWCYTIGNFRAWPFEDNRSDQAQSAISKLGGVEPTKQRLRADSFVLDHELEGFSVPEDRPSDIRHQVDVARKFVNACRGRLLRIYSEWYDSVGIADLIPPREQNPNFEPPPLH